jgi:hypothetical protein
MTDLSSYPNVYNTCLVIIERRGFKLSYDRTAEAWFAEKRGFTLRADNPAELLGIVSIFEEIEPVEHGEYWWKIDEPDLLSKLDPE